MSSTVAVYAGMSRDCRTNKWRITCPACGKVFVPRTTMSRYQNMVCPAGKCGKEMHVDYNAEPPVVRLVDKETS